MKHAPLQLKPKPSACPRKQPRTSYARKIKLQAPGQKALVWTVGTRYARKAARRGINLTMSYYGAIFRLHRVRKQIFCPLLGRWG